MSDTAQIIVVVGLLVIVGVLFQIARTLERIETVLKDRIPDPEQDDDEDLGL